MATLACMVLHNVCLDQADTIPSNLDLSIDPVTPQVRDRTKLREILMMKSSRKVVDPVVYLSLSLLLLLLLLILILLLLSLLILTLILGPGPCWLFVL